MKKYQYNNVSFFNFWEDYIYFLEDGNLVKIDLYKDDTIRSKLPEISSWKFPVIYGEKLYLLSENEIALYH